MEDQELLGKIRQHGSVSFIHKKSTEISTENFMHQNE